MKFERKYFANDSFFNVWSNNMAYVLGFWWADGYIYRDIFSISQNEKDKYILQQILDVMDSTYPLHRNHGNYCFYIKSKSLVQSLKDIGGMEAKSKVIEMPKVPYNYLPHFVRGVWDGDGSISLQTGRKSYHASLTCGSECFLNQFNNILIQNIEGFKGSRLTTVISKKGKKMPNGVLKRDSIYYMLRLGVNDTKRLGLFMYPKGSYLKLKRKEKIFNNLTAIKEATYNKTFLTFKEAKNIVGRLNIKNWSEWRMYCKSGQKPDNIPSLPNVTYKDDFKNIKDFLTIK